MRDGKKSCSDGNGFFVYFSSIKENYKFFLIFALLSFIYLLIRCFRLEALPLFGDEAIYLHWSRIIQKDTSDLFISFCDNKSPVYFIFTSFFYSVSNPLVSGRLVAVICGLVTMFFLVAVCRTVISSRAGYYAAFLYIFSYFFFISDRMVNPEVLVGCLTMAVIWSSIKYTETEKTLWCVVSGLLMGIGYFTKVSMLAVWCLPPFLLIISGKRKLLLKLWRAYLPALVFLLIRFFASRYRVFDNHTHFMKKDIFLSFPVKLWFSNFQIFADNITIYFSWAVFILVITGAVIAYLHSRKYVFGVAIFALSLMVFMILISKGNLYPRYFTMPFAASFVSAAYAVDYLDKKLGKKRLLFFLIFLSVLIQGIVSILMFYRNPADAPWPEIDKFQYFQGTFSGTGIKQIERFLREKSKGKKIYVFIPRSMAPPLSHLAIDFESDSNITIIPVENYFQMPVLQKNSICLLSKSPFQLNQAGTGKIVFSDGCFFYVQRNRKDISEIRPDDLFVKDPIKQAFFVGAEFMCKQSLVEELNPNAVKIFEYEKPGGKPSMKYYIFDLRPPTGRKE